MSKSYKFRLVISGDINKESLVGIEDLPSFGSDIDVPTRGEAFLEYSVSNLQRLQCVAHPPLAPDDPNKNKESDHHIATVDFALKVKEARKWITRKKRKYNGGKLEKFLQEFRSINWWQELNLPTADDMNDCFTEILSTMVNAHFELQSVRVREDDALWYTEALHREKRRVRRRYQKGATPAFCLAKKKYELNCKKAREEFFNHRLDSLEKNPARWHSELQGLMENGGRRKVKTEPEVAELSGLRSDKEIANKIADGIEDLTKDYDKLDLEAMLKRYEGGQFRQITLLEVQKTFGEMKLPRGFHQGDPPRELTRDASQDLAVPLCIIFNAAMSTSSWPTAYKDEQTRMIPKRDPVEVMKDLRPIVLTPYFGKVFKTILRKEILADVLPHLHVGQFGGLKGLSTDHYLACMYQNLAIASEAHHRQKGVTSILFTFDFTSAYNAMSHDVIVTSSERLQLRKELISIIASYLHQRQTTVSWGDDWSTSRHANGGSGQGTVFSSTLFVMTVDKLLCRLNALIYLLKAGLHFEVRSSAFMNADDLVLIFHAPNHTLPDVNNIKVFTDIDKRIESYLQEILDFSRETGMRLKDVFVLNCTGALACNPCSA